MKQIILTIITLLSYSIYSQNRYELLDKGKEKLFLSDSISKMAESGLIKNQPIIVINGIPFRFQDLENQKLPLSKFAIEKIVALKKPVGISIYGSYGEAGVLIITTTKSKIFLLGNEDDSMYYLVDIIKTAFQSEQIANTPLIAIDGVLFEYDKALNTIFLPLKKEEITDVTILNKNSSPVIYGKDEIYGAIIISTSKQ
ncbi:hypothetical protein FNW25_13700 [Flavobacterium franklandianum]|uniref:TonB-dependent receptor plug domain-containing protein n=1 Tax=Flavobacterium franklandianum TaxID=2594430 RepID=A0A553CJ59_9FLAO|nr:hypothetical protein [Flavobacterium franklandianum]TRX20534.1 hypothetical protein FNW17_11815 [Flavobacterium franklandianum]TRX23222.1 hypothetical protein FNW25_13700 [Flavobacterium franklandianum]